jgi:hypothetical protein
MRSMLSKFFPVFERVRQRQEACQIFDRSSASWHHSCFIRRNHRDRYTSSCDHGSICSEARCDPWRRGRRHAHGTSSPRPPPVPHRRRHARLHRCQGSHHSCHEHDRRFTVFSWLPFFPCVHCSSNFFFLFRTTASSLRPRWTCSASRRTLISSGALPRSSSRKEL